jgi:diguanylate cyclase (GGDEF)-like protein
MASQENSSRNFWPARIAAVLFIVVVVGSMATAALRTQVKARTALEDRFAVRATSASTFLDSYVQYTLDREQELAKLRLSTTEIDHDQFLDFLDNFGFGPSVLLDETGRVIDIAPYKEDFIGKQIIADNEHLRSAVVNGEQTVSNVVPSDALKFPNVAFATPFETQAGTRIISGAFDLTTKPLGNYFENIVPNNSSEAFLIDANGEIIASNRDNSGKLEKADKALPKAITKGNETSKQIRGSYTAKDGKRSFFVTQTVSGTPWKIVIAIEKDALYSPESGSKRVLPWVFLGGFALLLTVLAVTYIRSRERRLRLQDVSQIDLLTGIYNPRGVKSHLTRLLSAARRHSNDLTILKVDIDDFSNFNEQYGHHVGDEILKLVADEIQKRLRTEDIVGRCGGEEFIVILPDTDVNGTNIVAERIRRGVEEDVRSDSEPNAKVTISIGITAAEKEDTLDTISSRAEKALRDAKESGKNKIVTAEKA